jgi:hypothetical protein
VGIFSDLEFDVVVDLFSRSSIVRYVDTLWPSLPPCLYLDLTYFRTLRDGRESRAFVMNGVDPLNN